MQEKYIIKYIEGKSTLSEKKKVLEWIRESESNQNKFNLLKAKYIGQALKKIKNNDNEIHYRNFSKKIKNRKRYVLSWVGVAVLFLSVLLFWNYQKINNSSYVNSKELIKDKEEEKDLFNVITSNSNEQEVILPDGSIISLNIDSKLIYPKKFKDTIREVTLIGEAFFDIKRNVNKPFIVNANELKIRVLGTSFNVKSYEKDSKIETTLVTGKVELIKDKDTPIVLTPSQKAVFNKTEKKMKIEEVNSSDVIAWREGKLIFNKTSLKDVIKDLERKYQVQFVVSSESLLEYEYTGTFDNLKIKEVLDLLSISSPIKYSIKNEKIILKMK